MIKRIVNGVTYNTATSTLIARSQGEETDRRRGDFDWTEELYQTRGGAFWILYTQTFPGGHGEDDEDDKEIVTVQPLSREGAKGWLLIGEVEVLQNPFGDPPEAEDEPDP